MESGLFVTFFEPGEAFDRELPPVGPLDHVVARPRQLVADRAAAHQAEDVNVAIDRWLEAELELQRALGEEPGGTKRSELRVTSHGGVYLRFAVFGDARERDLVPELGPFAVVVVGRRTVEADGHVLATRGPSDLAPWELSMSAGNDAAGRHKPDLAFRATSGAYHQDIAPAAPRGAVAEPPRPVRPVEPPAPVPAPDPAPAPAVSVMPDPEPLFRPTPVDEPLAPSVAIPATPADEPPELTETDLALIQRMEREREDEAPRARLQEEERRRLGVDENEDATTWAMRYRPQPGPETAVEPSALAEPAGLEMRDVLWRMRFALVGVLVIALAAYGFFFLRSGGSLSAAGGGQGSTQTIGIAQKVSGARWDYVVNGVQRVPTSGTSRARGVYYVVRIGVTNRASDGAQISPSEFTLIDANGTEYNASGVSSGAYYGSDNTSSQYVWPQSFATGKTTSIAVVFDVDPSLPRGNKLTISELPRVRVTLD